MNVEAGSQQDTIDMASAHPKVHSLRQLDRRRAADPLARLTAIGSRWLPRLRPQLQANVHCLRHPSAGGANPSCIVCSALAQHEARVHYRMTLNARPGCPSTSS